MKISFVAKDGFEQGLSKIITNEGGVRLLVTHFLPYNTRFTSQWKMAGAMKLLAVDHMSRPRFSKKASYRMRHFLKGLYNYSQVDHIVAVSDFVKQATIQELGPWWGGKTSVIYNGVDRSLFQPAVLQEKPQPVLFAIAYLMEDKGIQFLLEALQLLKADGSEVQLFIAGDGPYRVDLEKQVFYLGLERQVNFLGNINDQYQWFAKADAVVLPSLWKEACPFTVIEAMSCGARLIASDIGGIPDLMASTGTLVPPANTVELAKAIKEVFEEKDSFVKRSAASSHASEFFSLNSMVSQHAQLIFKMTEK
jgi:glycosyltransferase involved in cell wall biosynthesis